jgi:mRNA interferase RelE/StbE
MRDAATMNRLAESDAKLARGEYVSAEGTRRDYGAAPGAVSDQPAEDLYELRTTSTVRRALGEVPPEGVAAGAYAFTTGPLLREPSESARGSSRLWTTGSARGTYRIIYRIDDKNRIVTVAVVDHRRDVYRS